MNWKSGSATLVLMIAFQIALRAQVSSQQDSVYLATLKSELSLSDSQYVHVDSVYSQARQSIGLIEKRILAISRSDASEAERTEKLNALAQEKKSMKEMRDLDMQVVFSTEQKKIFEEKFRPAKNVVHFGVNHDRASCTVCIPK